MLKGYDDYEMTAGDLLRGGRATLGLNIHDVANRLKLPARTLEEIEDGVFRGDRPVYLINSIIRDYAEYLGLDAVNIRDLYWQQVENTLLVNEQVVHVIERQPSGMYTTVRRLLDRLGVR